MGHGLDSVVSDKPSIKALVDRCAMVMDSVVAEDYFLKMPKYYFILTV